jgi:uncharacterized membrane protein
MPTRKANTDRKSSPIVNLSRLEALGDAVFAFALTLLALDLRLPAIESNGLAQSMLALLPKLRIFVFAFLLIAQQWDVHQRTMMHIARADGIFVWLYLLSLMFVVLMPASADILGRFPLQPIALVFFGINIALLSLTSLMMWLYASSKRGKLLDADIKASIVKIISRLWLFLPIIILITMPLAFLNAYLVYGIWILMPVITYSYSTLTIRKLGKEHRAARDVPELSKI